MADQELSFEGFIKQQIADIETIKKQKEEAFKARNTAHFNEMAALSAKQQPFKKLLSDFEKAKNGQPVNPLNNHGGVRVKGVKKA